MIKQLAQLNFAPPGGFKGFGPLGNPSGSGIDIFSTFISSTIGLMTIIAFIWFLFLLITGAIGIMTAGGDKAAVEAARKKITNGITGLIIVIIATFILSLIGTLLGIPNILNLNQLFGTITGGATRSGGRSI